MKKNTVLLHYLLLVGFVFLIFLILALMVGISRFVFSDVSPIGIHVSQTKELIEDISEVEKAAQKSGAEVLLGPLDYKKKVYMNRDRVSDLSYLNVNENKSFFSMIYDGRVLKKDGILYIELKSVDALEKGDVIVFDADNLTVGTFIEIKDDTAFVVDSVHLVMKEIDVGSVKGFYLMRE